MRGGIMKVEELERYGGTFEMPKEVMRKQGWIMVKALRRKFGILRMLGVFWEMFFIVRNLKKEYPETRKKVAALGKTAEEELFALSALFLALAKQLGRENVYEFIKTEIIIKIAPISMPWLYQLDDLKKCEGDVFGNFKKMNVAMFERSTKDGTWVMESCQDEKDKLIIDVVTCANVELFTEIGVSELGRFACDHDVAGYPLIEKDVNCDFRRLKTIANGDGHCLFQFYRYGTAPDNAYLNI
jgi:hypothetical protein